MTLRLLGPAVTRRRVVAVCVGLGVLVAGLVSAGGVVSAQVSAPQRGEPFGVVWFSVGDVRELDASSAFAGSVDSYTATSDNEAAVSASVTGSVVRLTAVASGVAFVEVTATNDAGSVSQWIGAVSAAASTADGDAGAAGDGGAMTEEDDAAGSGAGDESTGDQAQEAAGGDGGAMTEEDDAAGSGAGDESTGDQAQEAAGGDGGAMTEEDDAAGSGAGDESTGDQAQEAAGGDGGAMTEEDDAAGDESTGDQAQEAAGGDGGSTPGDAPRPLEIVLSSWAYCVVERPGDVRSYDDPDPVRDRSEVARFGVNYTVFGGRGPYVITSPHASSVTTDEAGVLPMACANPDPDVEGPVYRVDLYNPIDVSATVTDADGATASASMVVGRVVGRRYVDHGDGTVTVLPRVLRVENPENNYVVATSTAWTLVTLLPNVDLRFVSLSADGIAHFADAGGGSEVWVDRTTATETYRTIVVTAGTYSHRVAITPDLELAMWSMDAAWPWEWTSTTESGGMMGG